MCLVTAELSLTLGSDVEIYWGIDCTLAALTRLCLLMRRKRLWQQLLLECTRLCKPKLNLLQPNLRLRKNRLWQQLLLECSRPIPVSCAAKLRSPDVELYRVPVVYACIYCICNATHPCVHVMVRHDPTFHNFSCNRSNASGYSCMCECICKCTSCAMHVCTLANSTFLAGTRRSAQSALSAGKASGL